MGDTYRLTVSVTAGKGQYGYDRICDHEFQVTAPRDVLEHLDLSSSINNLFRSALVDIDAYVEPEAD